MPRLEDCPVCGGGIPADREACSCHQVQAALGASACSAGSDTPETDDNIDRNPDAGTAIVYADFARRLERERDEARRVAELYADRFKALGGYLDQEYFPWKQNAGAHQPERRKAMNETSSQGIPDSSDRAHGRGLGAATCSALRRFWECECCSGLIATLPQDDASRYQCPQCAIVKCDHGGKYVEVTPEYFRVRCGL